MTRVRFKDRGLDMRPRVDLTMAAYAEPPLIPRRPTNEAQRAVVAKAREVLPALVEQPPKVRGRPKNAPQEALQTAPQELPTFNRSEMVKAAHLKRMKAEALECFGAGPLTCEQFSEKRGTSAASGYAVLKNWSGMGLIVPGGTLAKANTRGKPSQLWKLA